MKKNNYEFNIVICGAGGQGLITLLQIIAEAAVNEGYDVRTSELHGLSQRGGSVEVHIRFGKKIYSPIVARGKADLILALEIHESLRVIHFANQKTKFLIDKYAIPILLQKNISENQILSGLRTVSRFIDLIPAFDICKKELGTGVTAGIYLLTLASFKKLLPLNPQSISKAIQKIIPEKYLELNQKTFKLAG